MADPRLFPSGSSPCDDRTDASGRRLYNPYHDLSIPYKHLYDLPTSPEFLFQEESLAQHRSWGENLTYYTGIGYLSGAVAGAALGLRDTARSAEPGEPAKIRANRVLNSCGSSGRRVGNTLGIIGLLYAGIESAMVATRDCDDWINSVAAGLGTGAILRLERTSSARRLQPTRSRAARSLPAAAAEKFIWVGVGKGRQRVLVEDS